MLPDSPFICARRARISSAYLGQLENPAHRSSPSADVLIRIAGALGTSLAELMEKTAAGTSNEEVMVPDVLRLLALELEMPEADGTSILLVEAQEEKSENFDLSG